MSSPEPGPARDEDQQVALDAAVAAVHRGCNVYTRDVVAEAILDAVGWCSPANLAGMRLLEPCCGAGAFLLPAIERLLVSVARAGPISVSTIADSIRAYEFDPGAGTATREAVVAQLLEAGLPAGSANRLANHWVRCEDFLLAKDVGRYTHVVGNPPYMRWSKLPGALRSRYEASLPSEFAKGDLCLAFLGRAEHAADRENGTVAFLCADRWLRCSYAEAGRRELGSKLRIAAHVEAHGIPVFAGARKVQTYAAVTILDRSLDEGGNVSYPKDLDDLLKRIKRLPGRARGASPRKLFRTEGGTIIAEAGLHDALSGLVERHPRFENAGISVRCGMALGCANAFIVDPDADLEHRRHVSFVRSEDLTEAGDTRPVKRLVNVWSEDGSLVDLLDWPRLAAHLGPWRDRLARRACVSDPLTWYRTIDRLHVCRGNDRILVAGMARRSRVALAREDEQPSNALYVVESRVWPVHALFALFRSGLLDLFAAGLAAKFSGGSRRFDGNLLRQVRIPPWESLGRDLKSQLHATDVTLPVPRADLLCEVLGIHAARQRRAVSRTLDTAWAGPVGKA